jgi:hypothetical protein
LKRGSSINLQKNPALYTQTLQGKGHEAQGIENTAARPRFFFLPTGQLTQFRA